MATPKKPTNLATCSITAASVALVAFDEAAATGRMDQAITAATNTTLVAALRDKSSEGAKQFGQAWVDPATKHVKPVAAQWKWCILFHALKGADAPTDLGWYATVDAGRNLAAGCAWDHVDPKKAAADAKRKAEQEAKAANKGNEPAQVATTGDPKKDWAYALATTFTDDLLALFAGCNGKEETAQRLADLKAAMTAEPEAAADPFQITAAL